ncbi:hypothetical protein RCH23_003476 [Cryobacterium sp. CAN_C3]|nr:hypothetical protein [Cryobacterium sp. CAN_C3]MEC5156070.1 hypothetical protein [Cryobacterium sp. CAN_C3]
MSLYQTSPDVARFVDLRKELTELRSGVSGTGVPLTEVQRDFVALAQAEGLCDLAATMNGGISVSTD